MAGLTLDWIQLTAALGAAHGVLLTGVLYAQRNNRTANRLLSSLVAACTVYLASAVYYSTPLFRAYPHFFGASYPMPWLFGPLVYLYARAAGDRAWRFTRRDLLHFVPATLSLLAATPYLFMSGPDKIALLERWATHGEPLHLQLIDPTKYISGFAYSIATIAFLRRHRHHILDSYSNVGRVSLAWLAWLSAATMLIWLLAAGLLVSGAASYLREGHVSLAIALLVYAIGYMGLRQPEVFRYETAEFPIVPARAASPIADAAETASLRRYERSGLSEEDAALLRSALVEAMETHEAWRDSELTLADLAARLDTTPHKLSEVLNGQIRQTFYDFVNGYRVREVQRRIAAGDADRLKVLALAFDAGFSSKSTFNQTFKKHTSQTPSDFRKTVAVS